MMSLPPCNTTLKQGCFESGGTFHPAREARCRSGDSTGKLELVRWVMTGDDAAACSHPPMFIISEKKVNGSATAQREKDEHEVASLYDILRVF